MNCANCLAVGLRCCFAGLRAMGMRVLVPYVAKPFYWLAKGRVGSWDPVMFGLLISDSFFYSLNRNLASACSLAAARKL